ncbi:hypothetical protein SESBI_06213 [Sesbania bispinosa]|nr:hypothetical protein SESBI_06213 [Sesbania bispinosa]
MVTAQDRGCGVWMGDGKKSGAVGRAVVVSARKGKGGHSSKGIGVFALRCLFSILRCLPDAKGLLFQLPGKGRSVVEFFNFQTSGHSIFVHILLFFGYMVIFLIAIDVHIARRRDPLLDSKRQRYLGFLEFIIAMQGWVC